MLDIREIILYGSYTIINLLAVILIDHWLSRSSDSYKNSVGKRVIVSFIYIALAFNPILAMMIRESLYQRLLLKYSYIWMGFLMYFGGMLLIATIVELIIRAVSAAKRRHREKAGDPYTEEEIERKATRRKRISGLVFFAILIFAIGLNVYGTIHARNTVITHYDVKIDKAVKHTKNLRVALIADLHLSYNSDVGMIKDMVAKLNAQKPDVVVVTGDLFSSCYSSIYKPGEYVKALREIKANEGVFWVYGNHDVEERLFCGFGLAPASEAVRTKKMKRFIKKSGFRTLEDECTAIARGEVQLAGRADLVKPVEIARKRLSADVLLNDLDKEKPIIILEHESGDYENLAKNGADLSLSGHTHNGQVFPGTIVTRLLNDMVYGFEERAGMQVIVTSGVGAYGPPLRIGTDSEIVIADITFK